MDRMGLDQDGVMIIHMGGTFSTPTCLKPRSKVTLGVYGDKEATLLRFRENYAKLSDNVKGRLVLENDEVRPSFTT